jgi:hypothetical protein
MINNMSLGRALSVTEGIPVFGHDPAEHYQRIVEKIGDRVVKAVNKGATTYNVKGGWFGVLATIHNPDVYADVASELSPQGLEIEAHRYQTLICLRLAKNIKLVGIPVVHDQIIVTALSDVDIERTDPTLNRGYQGQLYPLPEAQEAY